MLIESAQNRQTQTPTSGVAVAAPTATKADWLALRQAVAIEAEWAGLAADAAEPNPFYSPALLIPALDAFANENVRLAVVRGDDGHLIALVPLATAFGYSRLPVRYLATWMHPHCFFAAPLIRRGAEREALAALFDLAEREGAFFRLRHLDAEGAIFKAACAAAEETGRLSSPSGRYERALLAGGFETETYLQRALTGKKRKELRRLRARLEEEGGVAFEALPGRAALGPWIDDFLTLEAAGWKGRAGTALASDEAGKAFFAGAARRAFAAGVLQFFRLTVRTRPIAMIVNFLERDAAYSFKIAYDEAYARYSPGVMLEIEMMRALENIRDLSFIDSCAAADHPMINSLWRERRRVAALNISRRDAPSKLAFRILTELERAGEKTRARCGAKNVAISEDDNGDL